MDLLLQIARRDDQGCDVSPLEQGFNGAGPQAASPGSGDANFTVAKKLFFKLAACRMKLRGFVVNQSINQLISQERRGSRDPVG